MSIIMLSPISRTFVSFWSFTLCIFGIIGMILSFQDKKYRITASVFLLFFIPYLALQVIREIYLRGEYASELSTLLADQPALYWFLILTMDTIGMVLVLYKETSYRRNHITLSTIKLCSDSMPCGICYWRESGRVVFSNACMNELYLELTGSPMLDGTGFRQAIAQDMITVGDRKWNIVCKDLLYKGTVLHEVIASDVTEIYRKTLQLQKENEELSSLTEELKEFSLNIDDVVRREEILHAKINIHDEMNRLLLMSDTIDPSDGKAFDSILQLWKQNSMLLSTESNRGSSSNSTERLEQFAESLGIDLIWNRDISDAFSEEQQNLFFTAAREALTNAAKHAQADQMRITCQETASEIVYCFENNGLLPVGEVPFTGGLTNLSRLADQLDADIHVSVSSRFQLILTFKKAGNFCHSAE